MCPPEYKRNYAMGVSARKDTAFSDIRNKMRLFFAKCEIGDSPLFHILQQRPAPQLHVLLNFVKLWITIYNYINK